MTRIRETAEYVHVNRSHRWYTRVACVVPMAPRPVTNWVKKLPIFVPPTPVSVLTIHPIWKRPAEENLATMASAPEL